MFYNMYNLDFIKIHLLTLKETPEAMATQTNAFSLKSPCFPFSLHKTNDSDIKHPQIALFPCQDSLRILVTMVTGKTTVIIHKLSFYYK